MIMDDKDWLTLVRNIANGSANERRYILEACGYLWDNSNWYRLADTIDGKFLREVDSDHPDLELMKEYRKQVLRS